MEKVKIKKSILFKKSLSQNKALILLAIPGLVLIFVFKYMPMYGILMAFERYNPALGVFKSEWVGFRYFIMFFKDPFLWLIIKNTLILGFYTLVIGFPAPIILALLLNEVGGKKFKKLVQSITYLPNFISIVVIVGIMKDVLSPGDGIVNDLLGQIGVGPVFFFGSKEWFRPLYIFSGIWQSTGAGAILYLAALAGVDLEQYEAAVIDGATRMQRIRYITLPSIMPTVVILFIFASAGILGTDLMKILLMNGPQMMEVTEVIATYVYRQGLQSGMFSYATAIGLLTSVLSLILIFITNWLAKKAGETSLF
jgi:putative aldouronate transport system permease protein